MSAGPAPVLVIGDANVDLLVRLPDQHDRRRQPPPPVLALGGTGANTAVALRRLDVAVALLGTVGDDGYGRFVRRELAAAGVDVAPLHTHPDAPTMVVLAIVDPQGEPLLLGWPRRGGAQAQLRPEQVEPALVASAAWVHTSGICLVEPPGREAVLRGLALARAAGVPVSLDLNLRLGLEEDQLEPAFLAALWRAIALADVVLGSAGDELPYLTPAAAPAEAARQLAGRARTVVARLGAAGALAVTADTVVSAPAFPVPVVSAAGAGDAFNAGYIAAAVAGRPLAEALRWGNAAAALTISRAVGQARPDRAAVAALAQPGQAGATGHAHR